MLVPLRVAYPPNRYVEKMSTPGAAMTWTRSAPVPKLEKLAKPSSTLELVGAPRPHARPSESPRAVTAITSLYAAGTKPLRSTALLPAATTNVTPSATARQIAWCIASLFVLPQLPSSDPLPPRLMFATTMGPPLAGDFESTKSMPQTTLEVEPEPMKFSTCTAQSLASGATPTTPVPLSTAAIVPET